MSALSQLLIEHGESLLDDDGVDPVAAEKLAGLIMERIRLCADIARQEVDREICRGVYHLGTAEAVMAEYQTRLEGLTQ
jgi:hypothetical protein